MVEMAWCTSAVKSISLVVAQMVEMGVGVEISVLKYHQR
jgi:hypothetical protein